MIQQRHFWVYIQRNSKQDLKRYSHTNIQCSTVHNSKEMEAIHMSTGGCMEKENVTYTQNGISCNLKKRRKFYHVYDVGELQGQYPG